MSNAHPLGHVSSSPIRIDEPKPGSIAPGQDDTVVLTSTRHPAARRLGGLLISGAMVVVVLWLVRNKMPSPGQMLAAVTAANGWWVGLALALQIAAVVMLSDQQRRLLAQLGTGVGRGRMAAITVASTAVSLTVPAGGAVGAGWSFRQYRRLGASRVAASTVTVVSGLAGVVGLVILAGLMWATHQMAGLVAGLGLGAWGSGTVLIVLSAVSCSLWILLIFRSRSRQPVDRRRVTIAATDDRRGAVARIRRELRNATAMVRILGSRGWRNATVASIANRMLDAACLYGCCLAVGISVDFIAIALVYIGIQVIRQIPLTPGGIGVVEVAMVTGLTSIGVGVAGAAAVVVLYRLIAAWLVVPIGFGALVALQRRPTGAGLDLLTPPAGSRRGKQS